MRAWPVDRAELVQRNRRQAAALRRPGAKQRLRGGLLAGIARMPVRKAQTDGSRLLIVRPDHLGDVLLATPAIQALKRSRPDLSIHALCGEWAADVLSNYDEIDRVLTLPFPGFQRAPSSALAPWRLAFQTAQRLRRIGYASAIIMRPDHWWGALVAQLAGIPQRVGYDLENVAPFLTEAVEHEHKHAVEQNLRLVSSWIGRIEPAEVKLEFPLQPADRERANQVIESWQLKTVKPIVCIHPGSGTASKIWRGDKWAQVADAIAAKTGRSIVFTGTRSEADLVREIAGDMSADAICIAGETSIGQLAALYRRARAVLGPDSGALHLAAAVGTPTVALFGPADPVEFAPWGDPRHHAVVTADIGCRPCRILDWRHDESGYHPCVRDISVVQVIEAAQRVMRANQRPELA